MLYRISDHKQSVDVPGERRLKQQARAHATAFDDRFKVLCRIWHFITPEGRLLAAHASESVGYTRPAATTQ